MSEEPPRSDLPLLVPTYTSVESSVSPRLAALKGTSLMMYYIQLSVCSRTGILHSEEIALPAEFQQLPLESMKQLIPLFKIGVRLDVRDDTAPNAGIKSVLPSD